MKILGIDTSCDDTCVAILEIKKENLEMLSNIVSSQIRIHKKYGGVHPSLAKREHKKNLIFVLKKALKEAGFLKKRKKIFKNNLFKKIEKFFKKDKDFFKKVKKFLKEYENPKIDLIAVTVGPGLEPCLWQGINLAKALSFFWRKDVVPINHIEAHIFSSFLNSKNYLFLFRKEIYPAICLVVSGGHTQLILMKRIGNYKILGETRDDAAGECLDKTARVLGFSYPGGPAIEKLAKQVMKRKFNIKLPRPLFYSKDYDFSFSGLKTAVLYEVKKNLPKKKKEREIYIGELSKEIQQAIIDVLIKKSFKAAKSFRAKSLILGGGVVANKELRKQFKKYLNKERLKIHLFFPEIKFSTDNGAQIALTGYLNQRKKINFEKLDKIKAKANFKI